LPSHWLVSQRLSVCSDLVRVDALRLQAMLESSLIVALFALLPVLVTRFGLPTDTSWRICGAVWLLIQVPLEFVCLRRTKNMPDMTLARRNVNTINWCLSLASDAIMVGVVLGLAGSHAGAFYLASLFMLLVMSGLLFVQFAASTFVPAD